MILHLEDYFFSGIGGVTTVSTIWTFGFSCYGFEGKVGSWFAEGFKGCRTKSDDGWLEGMFGCCGMEVLLV